MWAELVTLILGSAFGYFSAGKQDHWGLLAKGLILGIILGILFALVILFVAPGGFGLLIGLAGGFRIVIGIAILAIIFTAGVFIGDLIEGAVK